MVRWAVCYNVIYIIYNKYAETLLYRKHILSDWRREKIAAFMLATFSNEFSFRFHVIVFQAVQLTILNQLRK